MAQCESIKPSLMSHHPRSHAPTLSFHPTVRSAHLNIPNEGKLERVDQELELDFIREFSAGGELLKGLSVDDRRR